MLTKIKVTQAHIDKNSHGAFSCPVALALTEVLKGECAVSSGYATYFNNDGYKYLHFPWPLTKIIQTYDGEDFMSPFEFYVNTVTNEVIYNG